MGEWIEVKYKIPFEHDRVLCSSFGNKVFIAYRCGINWFDDEGLNRDPTHWMPLPEPPNT
jgi:hypothetical protein